MTEPSKTEPISGDSAAASTVAAALSGETQHHLGLGKEGEKANYLKVRGYITVLNKSTAEEELLNYWMAMCSFQRRTQ